MVSFHTEVLPEVRARASAVAPWFLFGLYGIPYAATEGMTRAYVVDLSGPAKRAKVLGAYTFVLGIAALLASTVAGVLWDRVGHSVPFVVSGVLMAASALALVVAGRWFDRQAPAEAG